MKKNNNRKFNTTQFNNKQSERMKKYPWVPFVVVIIMAVLMIALNSFLIDFLSYVNSQAPTETQAGDALINIFR